MSYSDFWEANLYNCHDNRFLNKFTVTSSNIEQYIYSIQYVIKSDVTGDNKCDFAKSICTNVSNVAIIVDK